MPSQTPSQRNKSQSRSVPYRQEKAALLKKTVTYKEKTRKACVKASVSQYLEQ